MSRWKAADYSQRHRGFNPNNGSWSDPTSWDVGRVPGADDVVINVDSNPTIVCNGGLPSVKSITNAETLVLQCVSGAFETAVTASGDVVNHGTIEMTSAKGGATDTLTVGGTLTNAADRTIFADAGGGRTINAFIINVGLINGPLAINGKLDNLGSVLSSGLTVTGPTINEGLMDFGSAAGALRVNGNLIQTEDGALKLRARLQRGQPKRPSAGERLCTA